MAEITPQIQTVDIIAYLGDDLDCAVGIRSGSLDADGNVVPGAYIDFTGCTALAQIKVKKTDTTAAAEFTVTLGNAANNIRYSLPKATVTALGVGKWVYDVQITDAEGKTRTRIAGLLMITQDTSR